MARRMQSIVLLRILKQIQLFRCTFFFDRLEVEIAHVSRISTSWTRVDSVLMKRFVLVSRCGEGVMH